MIYHDEDYSPQDATVSDLRGNLQAETQAVLALCAAIEHHCNGQYVPESIARFCRLHAVNLDRDLARAKGETLPRLDYHMQDFKR